MKLIEALNLLQNVDRSRPLLPVGLICGFTPQPLDTFLAAHVQSQLPDRCVEVRPGRFGDLVGNLKRYLEESQGAAAVVLEWSDLDSRLGWREHGGWGRARVPDICTIAQHRLETLEQLLTEASAAGVFAVALPSLLPAPVEPIPSAFYSEMQARLDALTMSLAARLATLKHIRIVSPARLASLSPQPYRLDVKTLCQAGFPYSLGHADALAGVLAQLLHPPKSLKGIITDLDNTLWSGIAGEVGPHAVTWDLEHHSALHGAYQQMLQSLADSGVLIAVASKNDPAVVRAAMSRSDMLLRPASVFPVEAHWSAKSESVGRILKAWNIAPESVLFVDDSPLELAEVALAFPTIHCRLFEAAPNRIPALLSELLDLFGKPFASAEDSLRLSSLRAQAELKAEVGQVDSVEHVLSGAEGTLTISRVEIPPDPRALELINKTNQFNLNGRRIIEADWVQRLREPATLIWMASYEDRFGRLGNISVLAGHRETEDELFVDTWVLSCRAFARRIEYAMLNAIFEQEQVARVVFDFQPTDRNGPIQELLKQLIAEENGLPNRLSVVEFQRRKSPWYMRVKFMA